MKTVEANEAQNMAEGHRDGLMTLSLSDTPLV